VIRKRSDQARGRYGTPFICLVSTVLLTVTSAGQQLPIPQQVEANNAPRRKQDATSFVQQAPLNSITRPVSRVADVPPPRDALPAEPRITSEQIKSEIGTDVRQTEKQRRFEELKERLSNLIELNQQQSESPQNTETTDNPDDSSESTPPDPPEPDISTAESEDNSEAAISDLLDNSSSEGPLEIEDETITLPPIIPGTIDRIGLADNLFALEENLIALEMYSQVDLTVLPASDKTWVEYQMASCLRRLDRIPEAQERYRRLVAQKDDEWIAELSKWWLNRLDDLRDAREQLARFDQLISIMQGSSDVSAAE